MMTSELYFPVLYVLGINYYGYFDLDKSCERL